MKKFILTSTLLSLALFSCQSDNIIEDIKKQEETKKEEIKDKEEEKKEEPKVNTPPMNGIVPLKEQDSSFWSAFGKNDANASNIVDESFLTDFDVFVYDEETMTSTRIRETTSVWDKIKVDYLYKHGGKGLVRGEVYAFTPMLHISGKPFHGEIKMSLWQNGKLVEQYPARELKQEREFPYHGMEYPCFIQAPAGEYELRVLIRENNSDKWVIPPYTTQYNKKEHWMFKVTEKPNAPAIESVLFDDDNRGKTGIKSVSINKPFELKITLTNREEKNIRGEIKAVYERLHNGTMYEKENLDRIIPLYRGVVPEEDIIREWSDEVGHSHIYMSEKDYNKELTIYCKITKDRPYGKNGVPSVRFYFKAENSNEWELIRADYNSTLKDRPNNTKEWYKGEYDNIGNNYVLTKTY